jgi:hypothetical protein
MEAVSSPAQNRRAEYRHDLRALTYVVLDQANGGIIRNLTCRGAAIQAVAALPVNQVVRVRFELRYPRLRVEARGQVLWSDSSGRCGVRFLDLSAGTARQINEWIFGSLLESIPQYAGGNRSIFAPIGQMAGPVVEDDGLLVSSTSRRVIPMQVPRETPSAEQRTAGQVSSSVELDWLSQPLSGWSLAWLVDSLIVVAAMLLFGLVFLSVAHELPKWPENAEAAVAAAIFVVAFYWGFFRLLAGASMGARLMHLSGADARELEAGGAARFR